MKGEAKSNTFRLLLSLQSYDIAKNRHQVYQNRM